MYIANEDRYNNMIYNKLGKSGLKLSAISLGLWHNFGSNDNFENMTKMLTVAFDNGITHFDMANNYGPIPGSAEENFGKIFEKTLKPYRDELIISSKAGYTMWKGPYGDWGSKKYIIASLDQSLKRTGLEYFDIFYHHRFDPETPLEETMHALATAVHSGKALYAGVSNYDGEQTIKAAQILKSLNCPFVINQSKFSILNRNIQNNRLLSLKDEADVGVIAFCPLAQGLLTNRYINGIPQDSRVKTSGIFLKENNITQEVIMQIKQLDAIAQSRGESLAQMALSWVLAKGCSSVLIGASKPSQIEENVKAIYSKAFTDEEFKKIDEITI
ncbi:MAG: aldo/keto reductase [Clostridia bacterium]